ncbi:oxygenase MpaB family protein [Thermomicrobium sp.]
MMRESWSIVQMVNAERIVVLGWGRAILAQLAHPLVAAGVAEHSSFACDTWSALRRFRATVDAMRALTFGPPQAARAAAARIIRTHARVQGRLREPSGRFPAGTRYSAHDPALLAWVHTTTVEAMIAAYERFVRVLTPEERDRYCQEASAMEFWLGRPSGYLPRSWGEIEEKITRARQDGTLVVTPLTRQLADSVLSPPHPWWLAPSVRFWRWLTIGLLPDWLRAAYDLTWSARDDERFERCLGAIRWIWSRLPAIVRTWPEARSAQSGALPPEGMTRVGVPR